MLAQIKVVVALYHLLLTTCYLLAASYYLLLTTYYLLLTTYYSRLTTYALRLVTYCLQIKVVVAFYQVVTVIDATYSVKVPMHIILALHRMPRHAAALFSAAPANTCARPSFVKVPPFFTRWMDVFSFFGMDWSALSWEQDSRHRTLGARTEDPRNRILRTGFFNRAARV